MTGDVNTLVGFAYDRVKAGKPMPGVFATTADASLAAVIEDVLYLSACSLPGEWEGQVRFLPLR